MDKTKVILGPFDVALEEPVYFKIEPNDDGKTIKSVDMINGFVHRGIESIVLQRNFLQNLEFCITTQNIKSSLIVSSSNFFAIHFSFVSGEICPVNKISFAFIVA